MGVQRLLRRGCLGSCRRHRHAEQRVGPEAALGRRSVKFPYPAIDRVLTERITAQRVPNFAVDVGDRRPDTLPKVAACVAIAEFQRLAFARRRTGRHSRPAERAAGPEVDFNRGITTRI